MATRGDRLVLTRIHFSDVDQGPAAFLTEVLGIVEIDADERIVATVAFDLDDIDAAFEELDARYLAGEAAAHARTWSVIAGGYASINRHELPPTTPDCVSIDHRRTTAFAPGELNAYFRAALDLTPDVNIYVEAVHRLNDVGAVFTHAAHGISQEGFDAEWREVDRFDGRRRPGQPLRGLRRGRPRRRARTVRGTAARRRGGWKTQQAERTSASRRASRPAIGTR